MQMVDCEEREEVEVSDDFDGAEEVRASGDHDSDRLPGLTRENYVDRVRFPRTPVENRLATKGEASSAAPDPLYIYYRSMSKIPLLTREEEVYLAKKIESAQTNILRLLALTSISSAQVFRMADQLSPAPTETTDEEGSAGPEAGLAREKELRKITGRLKQLEVRHRALKEGLKKKKSRNGDRQKELAKIQKCREAIFALFSRIDFSESQVHSLVRRLEEVLQEMNECELPKSRPVDRRTKAVREAIARRKSLEAQHLTNTMELGRILGLIRENKAQMAHAKDEFVRANLRLVLSIAKHYSYPGLDLLDLVQEGNMGLMKAVDKFNYRLGHKFSTYATWWIRQSITRAIADQGRTIRVPVHMVEAMNRVLKTSNELSKRLGREPTVHELSKELKTPVVKITQILKAAQEPISLEASIADNKDAVLNKFIEDKTAVSPDDDAMRRSLREVTMAALQTLSPREQEIVRMRYGLNDAGKEYTLQEVGELFHVTRERIRQIEEKALLKLRSPYRSSKLREFSNFVSKN